MYKRFLASTLTFVALSSLLKACGNTHPSLQRLERTSIQAQKQPQPKPSRPNIDLPCRPGDKNCNNSDLPWWNNKNRLGGAHQDEPENPGPNKKDPKNEYPKKIGGSGAIN
jgi:hypothetical protein